MTFVAMPFPSGAYILLVINRGDAKLETSCSLTDVVDSPKFKLPGQSFCQ